MMLMGRSSLAADTMAEQIVAAPPMSALMRSMFAAALMEMPPLGGKGQCTMLIAKKGARTVSLKRTCKLRVNYHIQTPRNFQIGNQ